MRILAVILLLLAPSVAALAQPAPDCGRKPEGADDARLSGTWGGARDRLRDAGIVIGLSDQNEAWANAAGGARRGMSYVGVSTMALMLDPAKASEPSRALGWDGLCLYVSAYQIRGRGPTPNLVGALQPISSLEQTRATRLFDLWAEQALFDGKLSIRVGQGGANSEFMLSQYGALFMNSSFGFPALAALALPSGGPNYPLSTPFARLKLMPAENVTLLAAVFNGDPAGPGAGDPQRRNASGTLFRLRDPALVFAEAQIGYALPGADLAGTVKFGFWYHAGQFNDQAFDTLGNPLAAPWSNGIARKHAGNHAFYGGVDQLIWRPAGAAGDDTRGIGLFALFTGAPADRNPMGFSFIAGLNWKGPLKERAEDSAGLALAQGVLSSRLQRFGADNVAYGLAAQPYRNSETVLEATYVAQLTPWWMLQPSLQHVIHPGAGVPGPASPAQRRLPNATSFGLRSTVNF